MHIRKQYHFRRSSQGLLAWDVTKLIEDSAGLTVKEVKLDKIKELDECFWYDEGGSEPTCRNIVEHIKLIEAADLLYPIILSNDGRVMDGMHRVCKALLEGRKTILVMQFNKDIPPDYINVNPEDLPYD